MAKKKKEDAPAPGSPAWMATFSDLMNLLLCFFVLLFAMSSVDEGKAEALVNSIHKIMESLDLELEKACESLDISVEEYELMSKLMDTEKIGKVSVRLGAGRLQKEDKIDPIEVMKENGKNLSVMNYTIIESVIELFYFEFMQMMKNGKIILQST